MSEISSRDLEKLLYVCKANCNSEYLMENGKLDLLEQRDVKSLKEYILQLSREREGGKYKVNDLVKTNVVLQGLGEVAVYEAPNVSKNRKLESIKKSKHRDNEVPKSVEYTVISMKDKDKRIELVIDKDGHDLGIIYYDKNGKPHFEMSKNLKKVINERLDKGNVRSFVDEQTIQEEFYLEDINSLVKAIEEGIIVPESVKAAGERAVNAQNIKNGQYTSINSTKTITETPEEIEEKSKEEEAARKQLEDDEKEHERDITEKTDKDGKDKEDKEDKDKDKEDGEKGEENKNIPEDKIEEIDKICSKGEYSKDEIKSVLIIKDPSTLADCTENSKINRNGSEVTVIQFSTVTGKERYIMIQDEVELGGEEHDRAFRDLIAPLKATSGVYKRVEDNENYVDYTDSSSQLKSMQLKRMPVDMTLEEKDNFRERLEIDLNQLEKVRTFEPNNKALIDKLEIIVENDFIEEGLIPPPEIQEDANDLEAEPEEVEEASIEDIDEDPNFDEIGRRRRTR